MTDRRVEDTVIKKNNTIRLFLQTVAKQGQEDICASLSLAALLVWIFVLFWSDILFLSPLSIQNTFSGLSVLNMRTLWLSSEALLLCFLFILSFHRKGKRCAHTSLTQRRISKVILSASAVQFVGTSMVLYWSFISTPMAIQVIGVVACGFGSAYLLYLLGLHLARKGPQRLLISVAESLIIASLVDTLMLFLPELFKYLVVTLLPLVGGIFFYISLTHHSDNTASSSEAFSFALISDQKPSVPPKKAPGSKLKKGGWRNVFIRTIGLPLIVGLSYGIMQRLALEPLPATQINSFLNVLSFFISALLIIVVAAFFESAMLAKLICFLVIPVIAIAYVLLPLFPSSTMAAQTICMIGFTAFYFMVWALWSARQQDSPLARQFLVGLFVLVSSEALGSVVGDKVLEIIADSGQTVAIISLVVVYLLLMAGFFSFDRTLIGGSTVDFDNDTVNEVLLRKESLDDTADIFIEHFSLSNREGEVFRLLAKGRNRMSISKALHISDNTTRSHMRSIYRKLEVHSHQELLDLLEQDNN